MVALENKTVLVLGLGASGLAATALLCRRGAKVLAMDTADNERLRREAQQLRARGVAVHARIP